MKRLLKRFISLLKRLFMRLCKFCGSDISQLNPKAKYCSSACRLKDYRNGKPISFGPDKIHETPMLKMSDQPLSKMTIKEVPGTTIVGNKMTVPIPEISQNETKPDLSDIEFFIGKSGIKYRLSRELLLDLLDRFPEPTKKLQYIPADNTPMPGIFSISHLREPAYWEKPIQDLTEYLHFTEPYEETVNNANKMIIEGIRYNTISDYQKQYEDLVVSNGTQIEFQQLADDIKSNPVLTAKQILVLLHQINCIK